MKTTSKNRRRSCTHTLIQKSDVKLLRKKTLAADFRKRLVKDAIALK
jgi:hypothetical protein